jgi:3-phenylpropionate/trans-cinnamate dioxygenase ferredoxin reductase subunit
MTIPESVVIVGAGTAGFDAAAHLRELDYAGRILLIGDEPWHPYSRPPLSKGFLLRETSETSIQLRPAAYYEDKGIEVRRGHKVIAIDRAHQRAALDDDTVIAYDHLVLAVGARNRALPVPGTDLDGVFFLRTLDDAIALRARLDSAKRVVVIGAGFIGLEFAMVALKRGADVTVVDVTNRPLARALSPAMSAVVVREHSQQGVRLLFETQVMHILGQGGRVTAVEMVDGQQISAELVVIGIGVQPNVEVAAADDLSIDDGIIVDEMLSTSDPNISAIGDCASHPNPYAAGARVRLESVQNASDQGRCVAARLVGRPAPYSSVPWFWSDQGSLRLQIAGLTAGCDHTVIRGSSSGAACAVFCFRGDRFVGVETINRSGDHMIGRRLLSHHVTLSPEQAADEKFDLRRYAMLAANPP